ncbi:MAG TPA: pyrroline-5-carboxylate reductase, partial [Isosphaeraceae bacterium]|nr:pyrroline-5-carboxylate reductase [Isosphaeraceae bacterium]
MTSVGASERSQPELTEPTGTRQWGFIGSGKMATALIRGMLRSGVAGTATIAASDPLESARAGLAADTGVRVYEANLPVVEQSDVLVLAVKPQTMPHVLAQLRPLVGPRHLVVSIAAGISIAALLEGLGPERRIVRVMPNTPALLGEGASAYALGPGVPAADEAAVKAFLGSVGRAVRVPETMLDAVTGLSGSGPAFVYLMIEALSDGGVRVGLPRDIATMLAAQTVLGGARMVLETGLHPGVLKDQVTS